ncbi:MAG: putative bifunctional diguanylate cyclase/phosphodiesterase [Desulfuromonadales bacterium]
MPSYTSTKTENAPHPEGNGQFTVLLVEDDRGIRNLAKIHLERLGCRLLLAASGHEAVDLLDEHACDLMLLDFGLPDMTGQQLLDEISSRHPHLPFLVTTGHGSEKVAVEFMKRGALDYVIKDESFWKNLPKAVERARDHLAMVHRLERAKEALRQSEERYRALTENTNDVTLIFDDNFNVHYVSPSVERVLGLPPDEFTSNGLTKALHSSDLPLYKQAVEQAATAAGETVKIDNFRLRHQDSSWLNMEGQVTDLRHLTSVQGLVLNCRDITDRVEAENRLRENQDRLKHLAHHDPLTNLPNRTLFKERLNQALAKARRSGEQVAIVFLDLDRFKKINDTLGHEAGDQLLKDVAARLRTCIRQSDTVARLGGDEFVLVLEEINQPGPVITVAKKILSALAQPFVIDDYELYITTSIGISLFPSDGDEATGLMKCADVAMYRVKQQGRNNYQFYQPDMNARAREMLLMEGALRKALDHNELDVFYQPQLDLATGRLLGMEAMLRWIHPEQGILCPRDFLALAEETGLIEPYGYWAIQEACRQNKEWQDQGYTPVPVAINISQRLFHKANLVSRIRDILEQTGLAPQYLELEITEGMVMDDVNRMQSTMQQLDDMGVKLTLDDFGSGYSCLRQLTHYPITKLKIDQNFIKDVAISPQDATITATIIALGRGMKLEVIAEGVETPEQLRFLREHQCRQAQGFLFCHPLPPEQLTKFLDKNA